MIMTVWNSAAGMDGAGVFFASHYEMINDPGLTVFPDGQTGCLRNGVRIDVAALNAIFATFTYTRSNGAKLSGIIANADCR